jgi:hypothetical protein
LVLDRNEEGFFILAQLSETEKGEGGVSLWSEADGVK